MSAQSLFNVNFFLSLSGSDLFQYAEPFVNEHTDLIPVSVYELLKSKLADLDERHLVYALEICALLNPVEFAFRAVEYLSSTNSSVCGAAARVLGRIDADAMTAELVKRIAATPIVDIFTVHVRTGERIQLGTNEKFVRHLLSKYNVEWPLGGERCNPSDGFGDARA